LDANVDDDVYEAEWVLVEEYQDKAKAAQKKADLLINGKLRSVSPNLSSATSGSGHKRTYKLPKVEIKKFSGEIME